jgi:hypothetical protein
MRHRLLRRWQSLLRFHLPKQEKRGRRAGV